MSKLDNRQLGQVQLKDSSLQRWMRYRLNAELIEDAHPGSGSGAAGIDAVFARDRKGNPVIWASHLEGVLRDAARRLGDGSGDTLFGKAGGQRGRCVLASLYTQRHAVSRVWRSSARKSFDNRAPKDDTLRAIEFVPKGTRFEGFVEIREEDVPLLRRVIAEVDAIGSGRASGAGRINLTLGQAATKPRPLGRVTARLLLLLRNIDPVSITSTATPTNLTPAFPFIPGRSLLGALADWLWTANEKDAATALVSGGISIGDALPFPEETIDLSTVEISPVPLFLRSEKPKGSGGEIPWWSLPSAEPRRVDQTTAQSKGDELNTKYKSAPPDLFVYRFASSPWKSFRPSTQVRLRNGRPNPADSEPSLFAIEQIAEKTLFLAEIRGDIAHLTNLADRLRPVLEGVRWLRIGRGGAPVEVLQCQWAGDCNSDSSLEPSGEVYLTLTSDLLVRDDRLRWLTALDDSSFALIPGWPANVKAVPEAQDSTPVYGFNGTARLWRHPATAIRRGSVFRVEGPGVGELKVASKRGRWLGERTHEGFGRFRLDTILPGVTGNDSPAPSRQEHVSADDPTEVIAATTRRWFDQRSQLAQVGSSRPSLSQWLDLVADLERGVRDALESRMNPATVGKRAWLDSDAQAVLIDLKKLPNERAEHARMFVRWMRASMREKTL